MSARHKRPGDLTKNERRIRERQRLLDKDVLRNRLLPVPAVPLKWPTWEDLSVREVTMTDQEWSVSTDPARMLAWRMGNHPLLLECPCPPPSDRKLRLLACACARQVWHLLTEERSRKAVEVAERYADGKKMREVELNAIRLNAYQVSDSPITRAASHCCQDQAGMAANAVVGCFRLMVGPISPSAQAELLREILGNPWRPVALYVSGNGSGEVSMNASGDGPWWPLTPDVLSLARAAYEERPGRECSCRMYGRPGWVVGLSGKWEKCSDCKGTGRIEDGLLDALSLAVVADAIEEAGCDNTELLAHLRGRQECLRCKGSGKLGCVHRHGKHGPGYYPCQDCNDPERGLDYPGWAPLPGPHVRGCWSLDLVLGKS